jgi:hypothetical protein
MDIVDSIVMAGAAAAEAVAYLHEKTPLTVELELAYAD